MILPCEFAVAILMFVKKVVSLLLQLKKTMTTIIIE